MGCFRALSELWLQHEQFVVILVGFWCMGAGCGFERSLLPRMAKDTFGQTKASTCLAFVSTFGLSKAVANAIAGPLADYFGRKQALVLGCLVGLPVMPFIIVAHSWHSITLMNAAFGLSQGLLGSSLFFLLIDVMGPTRRGVAVGIGECSIYVSTALVNVLAGQLASAYGYRPVPFYVATGFTIVGLLSTIPLQDTLDQVRAEQTESERVELAKRRKYARMMSTQPSKTDEDFLTRRRLLSAAEQKEIEDGYISPWRGSAVNSPADDDKTENGEANTDDIDDASYDFNDEDTTPLVRNIKVVYGEDLDSCTSSSSVFERDLSARATLYNLLRTNPSYVTLCFGGMVLNFKDGFAWGSFPVFFKHEHLLSDAHTDLLIALYPLCWGFAQAFTGAMSDKFGRKVFLVTGIAMCSVSMALFAVPNAMWGVVGDVRHVTVWVIADVILGLGTAMAYPALQAGAADEVTPINRGLALGFYRFFRDMGYVVGGLVCGHLTDAIGYESTFLVNSAVLATSLLSMVLVYRSPLELTGGFGGHKASKNTSSSGDIDSEKTPRKRVKIVLQNRCSDSW